MEQQGGARTEQMRLALTDCYLSDCVPLIVACKMYLIFYS